MASYFNIPLDIWEKQAQAACFSTELKSKEEGEQFFYHFVQNPNIQLLLNLIANASDIVLFALFSYILKHPQAFVRDTQPFFLMANLIGGWPLRELTFARQGHKACQDFVTRTIMSALGAMMKGLYESGEMSSLLVEYIEHIALGYFKIYMLKCFIQAVEVIDTDMGYMRFRSMVYSFQDNVIPLICETLIPFFQNFEEGVRISELQLMQSKLGVSEQKTDSERMLSLSRQQQMQSQLVLMLLRKIVEFNYNITYTEYQSEQAIDTCLITFPDKVLEKIINHDFLRSLFYVVEKVCEIKIGQRKNQFLAIVLECLAKIMQARLGYVGQHSKQQFICSAIVGLTRLLEVCQQLQSETLLQGILVCNKKLFMSVELTYIQKVLAVKQNAQPGLYDSYVNALSWMILQIVRKSYVQTENTLLTEALEVTTRMITCLSYKDLQNLEDSSTFFLDMVRGVVTSYVGNLSQARCIFPSARSLWMSENKQGIGALFQLIKKISSYAYADLFKAVDYFLDRYLRQQSQELSILANLLFFISELVDHNFLERSVNLNKAKDSETLILAQVVKKATGLAQSYAANRKEHASHKDAHYLDIAVLIFSQALLVDFLTGFQSAVSIKIKQKLYLMMVFGQNYDSYLQPEDTHSEPTLLAYLSIVFKFLSADVPSTDIDLKMLYALEIVQKVIFKLKWNMRRETFLKCELFKHLLAFFDEYFTRCYPVPDIMAKVGKITVTLNFDDVLDEYKFRINKFIGKLPSQDKIGPVFFYLTGVFEGIQPGNICRYFCGRLKMTIDLPKFFAAIFQMALQNNTDRDYKDVCRFCRLVILNKGLKTSSNGPLVYELFNLMLPRLLWFLRGVTVGSNLNVDLLGDAIHQLIDMFCGVINGTHVNLFVLDNSSPDPDSPNGHSLAVQYVTQFFSLLTLLSPQLKLYPKLQEVVLYCMVSINKQILEFIYDGEDGGLAQVYNRLIVAEIDKAVEYVTLLLDGNKLVQDRLLKCVDSLRLFYQYFNRRSRIRHKPSLLANLGRFYQMSQGWQCGGHVQNKNEKLAFYMISLILTNHKNNISYVRSISKLIYQLNRRFQNHLLSSLVKLRVSTNKVAQAQHILLQYGNDMEQNFVQKFKGWVKELNEFK